MHYIKEIIEQLDEEVADAKKYAERYVENKAKENSVYAAKYKAMSEDELRHAMFFHEIAIKEIEKLSEIYTAPIEMQKIWEEEHKKYVEKVAWIKQMLSM